MKKSKYNYFIKYRDNKHIVFNTFNTSMIVLDEEHYNRLINYPLQSLSNSELDIYIKNGIIINDDLDEKSIVDFDRGKTIYRNDTFFFRILTTTDCNARCKYCYEHNHPIITMDKKTADAVFKYIADKTKNSKKFSIGWFGGEPLLNAEIINYLSEKLELFANNTGKKWNSGIITNASLFSPDLIEKAVHEWRVKNVQITLDGTKYNYERIKNYKDGTQFEYIINVINQLINNNIYVAIRLNFDNENFQDIKSLIALLSKQLNVQNANFRIYAYPIFNNNQANPDPNMISRAYELNALISEILGKRKVSLPKYSSGRCKACSVSGDTILPNGDLIKCSRYMNYEKSYANVQSPKIKYTENFIKWCTMSLPQKCEKCILLPICQGGCKAEQLLGQDGCTIEARNIDQILWAFADEKTANKSLD